MTIDAIGSIGSSSQVTQEVSAFDRTQASQGGFMEIVNKGLVTINEEINSADRLMVDYVLGKDVSTHDLMIAMEKARHSMQIAVEVRNQLVEAYQKITSMQV